MWNVLTLPNFVTRVFGDQRRLYNITHNNAELEPTYYVGKVHTVRKAK